MLFCTSQQAMVELSDTMVFINLAPCSMVTLELSTVFCTRLFSNTLQPFPMIESFTMEPSHIIVGSSQLDFMVELAIIVAFSILQQVPINVLVMEFVLHIRLPSLIVPNVGEGQ